MKLREKTTAALIAIFMISAFAMVIPVSAGYGKPTIDGTISEGEWGDPTFQNDGYFNVYVLNDAEYLYVGFETLGGTYLPTGDGENGMTNVYTMNPVTEECWAYCWTRVTPDLIELNHGPTDAQFAVTDTVFELQIPISELESISLGDTINFHFLSYAEGMSDWGSNTWLYNQEYTLELPPKCRAIANGTPDNIKWYGTTYTSSGHPDLHATAHITRSGQAGFTVHSDSIPMHITATFEVVFVGEEQTQYGPRWVFESVGPVNIRVDSSTDRGYTVEDIGQVRVYLTYGDHGTLSIGPFSDVSEILKVTNVPLVNYKQW